jgi:hypothetical protein
LKGPLFLLGRCLLQERNNGPYRVLARRCLDLGLLKTDSTRGHVFQATGAAQRFLLKYPHHRSIVNASPKSKPYKPTGQVLADWRAFLANASADDYGTHLGFAYNFQTLKGYLTPKYGGLPKSGGGGDNEFEIAMRLVAALIT